MAKCKYLSQELQMAKEMKLEEIIPVTPQAEINGGMYTFRAPNLGDMAWMQDAFGGPEALQKAINLKDWAKIARLAYHLIDERGRSDFRAQRVRIISETTGEEVERFYSGPEVLLEALHSAHDGVRLIGAICRAMANSDPMVSDLLKKSLQDVSKIIKPIGAKSSTPSLPNTVGQSKKSKSSHSGK